MNILVTGGTGFIGIYLIPELISKRHSVRILVRNKEKSEKIFGDSCEIFIGDITDKASLEGCCNGIDMVYHMVAKVGNDLPSDEAYAMFRKVNVEGIKNIVSESKKAYVKKFILVSSIAAMGIVLEPLITEKSKCDPYLPYQVTKYEGEQVVLKEFQDNNFHGIIVRPTKVYGQGEHETSYLMLAKLCKKGFFPKVGKGKNYTSNVYIKDLVQGLVQLVDHGNIGEIYILTSDGSIGLCETASIIASALNKKVHFIPIPVWCITLAAIILERTFLLLRKKPPVTKRNIKATISDGVYDISKAKNELGYRPETSMEQGIKYTVRWYIDNNMI